VQLQATSLGELVLEERFQFDLVLAKAADAFGQLLAKM